jgi:hypothetical protein
MKTTIYEYTADLPPLTKGTFFHSAELMWLCEQTPRHKPYMVVVTDDAEQVVAHLLAVERVKTGWLPPYRYTHVRVLGDGIYADGHDEKLFGLMVDALTERLQNRVLYMEFSNLSQKMFGYGALRSAGYFPVRWTNVHNSLHSRTPEERITERQLKRVTAAIQRGVTTKEVETDAEFRAFSKLLRHHNWLKPRRYLPDDSFFRSMSQAGHCKLFITQYRGKTIGCSVCVYSEGDAYLWYSAARRKSYATLHPNAVTYWNTISDAHRRGCQHIRFMDVGLPFRKNPYRDFILSFGGKEVSTYRWFRISIRWVNRLSSWLWRE